MLFRSGSKIRALVVDDSVVIRRLVSHALSEDPDIEVAGTAADGSLALARIPQVNPHVVTLDIEMPNMDGFDLTRNVRADARTSHMPLVMITSRTAEKHRRYAAEIGVNVYLGKPFNEDELLRTLQQLIGDKAAATASSVAQMLGEA